MTSNYNAPTTNHGDPEPVYLPEPSQDTAMVCIHHYVLEPVGMKPKGVCSKCGHARVFTNELYDKPGFHKPTERQRDAMNRDLKARKFAAIGLTYQGRYD